MLKYLENGSDINAQRAGYLVIIQYVESETPANYIVIPANCTIEL